MAVRKEVPKDERVWAAPAYKSMTVPQKTMEKVSDQLKPPPAHLAASRTKRYRLYASGLASKWFCPSAS